MKYIRILFFAGLVLSLSRAGYSQGLSIEAYSGTNFSNIHGQEYGGKWQAKPGPSEGINLKFNLSGVIGFQTGFNYSTVYYDHKQPLMYYPAYLDYRPPYFIAPYVYPTNMGMDFSYIRVPLLFTVTVPSKINFTMKAGIFYSFLSGHNLDNYYAYYPIYDLTLINSYYPNPYYPYPYTNDVKVKKNDFGYMFSAGLSYPLTDKFAASFNAAFITGRKRMMDNYFYKNGSSEFTIGLEYTGFLKKRSNLAANPSDSASKHVAVAIFGGMSYSWNGGKEPNGHYNSISGPTAGFSLDVPLGKGAYFQTGFSFERKGFSMRDSSALFYRLIQFKNSNYYVDSKVQIDYGVIPALLKVPLGKEGKVWVSTGPWLALKLNSRTVGKAYNELHYSPIYQFRETVIFDDLEDYTKNLDSGWLAAFGIKIPVAKNELEFSVKYSSGFRDVFIPSKEFGPSDPGLILKNRTLSFVLGFKLPSL